MIVRRLEDDEVERVVATGLGLSRLNAGTGFYLVAWESDEPLGHAHLAVGDPPELQDVSVRAEHRRRGVATVLTLAAEDAVRERGGDRLTLTVSVDNPEAQEVYRRLGYEDAGVPPRHVRGTVLIRTGPLEVDDTLLTWEKRLRPRALLLHGGPGLNDYTAPLAAELAPLFEVAAYQQGRHTEVGAYVAEALDRLPAPAWAIGHSWGAYLAMHLAAAQPERLLGLVLVGGVGAVGDGGRAEAVAELRSRLAAPPSGFSDLWPAYFSDPVAAPPFPDLVLDAEQYATTTASMDEHGAAGTLERALPSFDRPVLLLHGTHDHIPLHAVERTAALLPDARLRVLDGVGHFPWLEHPGIVAREIVDSGVLRSS